MWAIWAWANGGGRWWTTPGPRRGPPWRPAPWWTPWTSGGPGQQGAGGPRPAYRDLGKSDHFAQGKASLYNNGRWMVPLFRRSTFNWDVMLMPRQKQRAQLLTGSIFGLSKATRWQNESWALLQFVNSKESQALMTEQGLLFPSRQSVARSDTFLKSPPPQHSELFLKDVEVARVLPLHPRYPEMEKVVGTESDAVLDGAKTARRRAKEMTTQVNPLAQGVRALLLLAGGPARAPESTTPGGEAPGPTGMRARRAPPRGAPRRPRPFRGPRDGRKWFARRPAPIH